jgi:acyl-CoA reductase-like NAD-dependent aldehyde dehydrogenase
MAPDMGIERLQMAVVDGRTENIRYRQGQFHALHAALRTEAAALCEAMAKDSQAPKAEVETEFYLAMETLRHFYDTLDFGEEHKKEYSVTHGKDNKSRRLGVGLVVIRPTSHTRLYSIISAMAAAMSAGNCIILEVSWTDIIYR